MTKENSRLFWRCRRGIRELDSILVPYGLTQIPGMTPLEISNLDRLLEQSDPDLLDWFLGKRRPGDSSIADAVCHVLSFNEERARKEGFESMVG